MLVFIIPIKSPKVATSWTELSRMFERSLRSVCNQTSSEFHVIVVCHEKPQISFHHPHVQYIEVDFPPPSSDYTEKCEDKTQKVAIGLLAAQQLQPTHIMSVDADDCISNQLAAFVNQNKESNGWYMESGYEYEEGSNKIFLKNKNFYKLCGTCNIINNRLFTLPKKNYLDGKFIGYDKFLTGHPFAKGDLALQGTPLQELPFLGTIYVRDKIGESTSLQEPLLAKLKRSPKEAFRGLKKFVLAPLKEQKLTDTIRAEFGLYPLL